MFKVKATVVNFLGNQDLYPCHMGHKIGDEVIFDGESYTGRLCPDVWPLIAPKVAALHQAGPRYKEWASFYPFWYCSVSKADLDQNKYDGLGFKNVLETIVAPQYDMASLAPPNAFQWPPHAERNIAKGASVTCPDSRTSMVVALEAFDLSDKGFNIPYYRRQMGILSKLQSVKAVKKENILNAFSKKQVEGIYPPLSPIMIDILTEELELIGYVVCKKGSISITLRGKNKLSEFKNSINSEERELFEKYHTCPK
jgi:uncharacterized repeat protein (TIGR04076 family)